MLLYSTLLCRKIARVPGGHKRHMLTKLGGGEKQNRSHKSYKTSTHLFFIRFIESDLNSQEISSQEVTDGTVV